MPIALCPLSPLQLSLTANIIVVLTVFRGTRLTESHTRNGSYSAHKNRVGHASSTEFNSGNDALVAFVAVVCVFFVALTASTAIQTSASFWSWRLSRVWRYSGQTK